MPKLAGMAIDKRNQSPFSNSRISESLLKVDL
jgi:hypothetical protein